MKKILVIIAIMAIGILPAIAFAEGDINVIIDNEVVEFDVQPCIVNDTTLVPMRKIFEKLGAKVDWVPESQLIIASSGTSIIAMEIGICSFTVTDVIRGETRTVDIDVAAQIMSDRTFVPIRAVSESLNKSVEWDEQSRTITIK